MMNKDKLPIWGSLPFISSENANDHQSIGVKVGRCDGERNIGTVTCAGSTIIKCSMRDLMRRKRHQRCEHPKAEICHGLKVTKDDESNKSIMSSPKKKVFSTKFSLPSFLKQVTKLTDNQKDSIKRAGFGNLLLIPDQVLRRLQLIQLIEKWSCEKQAFLFPPGELKITLLDVSLILGLRVIGQPVVLKEDAPLTSLEKEFNASVSNRTISVEVLKERLESIGERDDDSFIRVFLLYCFGILLFPSANGKVDSRYLNLLQDVDNVSSFAWGAAVIEDLTQKISKKTSNIGGCLILLQIWCFEHIIIGRPKLLDYPFIFPRACRWESSPRNYSTSSQFDINFDELEHNQILWELQPTSEEIEIDIIREISQEWHLRTGPTIIEQSVEVQGKRATRMVEVVEEDDEEEEPVRQEKSTIFVISDDEESKLIKDLQTENFELNVIIEELKEREAKKIVEDENEIKDLKKKVQDYEELRKRVQDVNEELKKRFQDDEELRKRVINENEELKKRVQDDEELRKRVLDENEELMKRVQIQNEELRKRIQDLEELRERVQYEEELRKKVQNEIEKGKKRAEDENEKLKKRFQEEKELRKKVHDENEKLTKRIQDVEELIKRVQDESEKRRKRVQDENDELRKRIQDAEELKKKVQYEEELRKRVEDQNEELKKRVQDEKEIRKKVHDENEKLRKRIQDEEELIQRVQDEEELRKRVQDENEKRRKRVQHENDELKKRVQDVEELKKRVQYEEELRRGVEDEYEELRKKVQDEEELSKRVQIENEVLRKRVQDELVVRKRIQDENVEIRKSVEDEQELSKLIEAENEQLGKRCERAEEIRKRVEDENEKLSAENTLMDRCISDLKRLLLKDNVDL